MEIDPLYCDVIRRRWSELAHGDDADWRQTTPAIRRVEASTGKTISPPAPSHPQ